MPTTIVIPGTYSYDYTPSLTVELIGVSDTIDCRIQYDVDGSVVHGFSPEVFMRNYTPTAATRIRGLLGLVSSMVRR